MRRRWRSAPGSTAFISISDPRWAAFLEDPFDDAYGAIDPPLDRALQASLAARVGPGAAANHVELAKAAERALEALVESDIAVLRQTPETFRFFCSFANEVMDTYARLLCYINRDQPNADDPEPRPKSYNERLLALGHVTPYFIWPNLDPYRPPKRPVDAVPVPKNVAPADVTLDELASFEAARESVRQPGHRASASSIRPTHCASTPSSFASFRGASSGPVGHRPGRR